MNQTTTTATTNTDPVDLEALRLQLEEDANFYNNERRNPKEGRERLLQVLQNNDCREIITAVVNGDDLANAFARAGERRHINILEVFLNHGINVDIKNQADQTALIHASCNNQEECVRFLLDLNASVGVQEKNGLTALMRASYRGFTKIVEMLLEKSTNPDIQTKNGQTALMKASMQGHKETVQLLLNHGADIELKNDDGKTALDLTDDNEIKEMLLNHVNTSYVLK